jgi:hypothetical protein
VCHPSGTPSKPPSGVGYSTRVIDAYPPGAARARRRHDAARAADATRRARDVGAAESDGDHEACVADASVQFNFLDRP